jgi:hypothetical protein
MSTHNLSKPNNHQWNMAQNPHRLPASKRIRTLDAEPNARKGLIRRKSLGNYQPYFLPAPPAAAERMKTGVTEESLKILSDVS